mgnify:CR=1 FL=1
MKVKIILIALACLVSSHSIAQEHKTIEIKKHSRNVEYHLSVDLPGSKDIDKSWLFNFIYDTAVEELNNYGEEIFPKAKYSMTTESGLRENLMSLINKHLGVNKEFEGLTVEWMLRLISESDKYWCYKSEYDQNEGTMYPTTIVIVIRKSDCKRITEFVKADRVEELNAKIGNNLNEYLCNDIINKSELIDYLYEYSAYELTEDCWIDSQYFYIQHQKPVGGSFGGAYYFRIPLSEMTPYLTDEMKALIR